MTSLSPQPSAESYQRLLFSEPWDKIGWVIRHNSDRFPEVDVAYYKWLSTMVNEDKIPYPTEYLPQILSFLLDSNSLLLRPLYIESLKTPDKFRKILLGASIFYTPFFRSILTADGYEAWLKAAVEENSTRFLASFIGTKRVPSKLISDLFTTFPRNITQNLMVHGQDSRLTAEVLDILSYSAHQNVLTGVALNRNTSQETLHRLAQHPNMWVRRKVALNPHTPADILERLANDRELTVRIGAARNIHTPVPSLWQLAGSGSKQVTDALSKNSVWVDILKTTHEKGH